MCSERTRLAASFRDPSGYLFWEGGKLFRRVDCSYRGPFEQLTSSGLYQRLAEKGLLIRHQERGDWQEGVGLIIEPEMVPFISYPFEWCFSQLKQAALTTLRIQLLALERGMTLKDASAYNIQFLNNKPILIDSLSFEIYREGEPWVALRQFCQHFLAPLALMSYRDVRLSQLLRVHLDGIPLDLASQLLGPRSWLNLAVLSNLFLHSKLQAASQGSASRKRTSVKKEALELLIKGLRRGVEKLGWSPSGTEWAAYYSDTNYSGQAMQSKRKILKDYLEEVRPETLWDLGANDGSLSRLASSRKIQTIAFDTDPAAVEKGYLSALEAGDTHLLNLLMDLTNPSSSMGWALQERDSLVDRAGVDAVWALALIHHLAISNNLPLEHIARFLARLGRWLVIEFVPKEDSQVKRLLATREDIFPNYHQTGFELAFRKSFDIRRCEKVQDSQRSLYLMQSLEDAS